MRHRVGRKLTVLAVTAVVVSSGAAAPPSAATPQGGGPGRVPAKTPVAVGRGGAVSSVDADASAAGVEVLRKGGNAVDAAVATAAALGATEPYSAGIGGGGYFVHYDARSRTVRTIDGRETAPLTADAGLFLENGTPVPFAEPSAAASPSVPRAPRPPGSRRSTRGAASPCGRSWPPHSGSPATDSPSTAPSAPRPPPTRPASATSPTPPSCSCPAVSSRSSAPPSRTPISPAPTRS